MKTFNVHSYNIKYIYLPALAVMLATMLILGSAQLSEAYAEKTDTIILAVGPGGGSGGGGGGSGGSGGARGGGEGGGGGGEGGGEGEDTEQGNNLSFPAIAADGYVITSIASSSFATAYEGPYTGLSAEEIAALDGSTWYAQKTEGNVWQAAYTTASADDTVVVYGVDWGDNIEAVDPVVGNPFRIEVGLYNKPELSMLGYTMALLANPSSPDEVQGTDGTTYESDFAVVVSENPELVIQDITDVCTTDLIWSGAAWTLDGSELGKDSVSFAPELNVGGKYVYGASQGGWRPTTAGMYRLTMFMPESDISLTEAVVGNYTDWVASVLAEEDEEEVGAATPVIDTAHNLTFVDVIAVEGSGGREPGDPGTDTYDPCAVVIDDTPATSTDPVITDEEEDGSSSSSGSSGGSWSSGTATPTVAGASTLTQYDIDLQKRVIINSVRLVNIEYVKLLQLIAGGSATQQEIELQKAIVMNHIKLVKTEYSKLLQMLLERIRELASQLQARS